MKTFNAEELRKIKFHPLPYTHITPSDVDAESYKRGWNDAVDSIMENAPTLILVKTGHWVGIDDNVWECDVCGWIYEDDEPFYNFCPHCGAKMDVSDTDVGKMEEKE